MSWRSSECLCTYIVVLKLSRLVVAMVIQKKELVLLLKPYYWINIILTCSYVLCKKTDVFCQYVFAPSEKTCEFDSKELEILLFLMIVVMIRTRKAGSVNMITYLSSSFLYTKAANFVLWFYADVRYGLFYTALVIVFSLLLQEPTYSGPENVVYFKSLATLEETLKNDREHTVWLVCFYTVWNPTCNNFAPIFSQLSVEYNTKYLKFGKIDISRYHDAALKYNISDTSLSRQLPTVIMFKNGVEVFRRPSYDNNGKIFKFFFTEPNFKGAFDLNNVYIQCKTADKKH